MVADNEQTEDENAESGKGKGKSGKTEGAGSIGATKAVLTPAFIAYMNGIGASMELITLILREWSNLKGENLTKALALFSRDMARASSQAQVQFDGKDFAVVHNILRYMSSRDVIQYANKLPYDGPSNLG